MGVQTPNFFNSQTVRFVDLAIDCRSVIKDRKFVMVSYLRSLMPMGVDGRDVPLKSSLQCTGSILSPLSSLRPSVPFSPLLSFVFCLLFHPQNSDLGTGRSTTAAAVCSCYCRSGDYLALLFPSCVVPLPPSDFLPDCIALLWSRTSHEISVGEGAR